MRRKKVIKRRGFTLIEQVMAMVTGTIVVLGMGTLLVDGQNGWNRIYDRVYGDITTDAYVARKTFDTTVRRASGRYELLSDDREMVEVYYCGEASVSATIDSYARFYTKNGKLLVDYGILDGGWDSGQKYQTNTLAHNVDSVSFSVVGRAVEMKLTLNDGFQSLTVVSSAIRYNE